MKHLVSCIIVLVASTGLLAERFDETLVRISKAPQSARQAAIDTIVEKGTPVVAGNDVTFLARLRDGDEPRLVGGFNGWGRYPNAAGLAGGRMKSVSGTDWFYATATFPSDARIEYGFEYGNRISTDPDNTRRVTTFGELHSVLEMPAWKPSPSLVDIDGHVLGGRLESFAVQTDVVKGGRKIHVYLPPGYPDDGPYPVAYFNDGTIYAEELRIPAVIDRLVTSGALRPLIGVFVDPIVRREDYSGSRAFLEYFTTKLVPDIDERYRTDARAESRAIIGGSRGARAALRLAWQEPLTFGQCGMLEPAITPSDILEKIAREPARPIDFDVVAGLYDVRFVGDAHLVVDLLRWKGYPVRVSFEPVGHTPHSWKHAIPGMLIGFFAK